MIYIHLVSLLFGSDQSLLPLKFIIFKVILIVLGDRLLLLIVESTTMHHIDGIGYSAVSSYWFDRVCASPYEIGF